MQRVSRFASIIVGAHFFYACATSPPEYGGPASQPPAAEIPYRIDYQGWITVDGYVNGGGPYDFIVDSGATITSVFANLSELQDFPKANRAPIQILGLSGSRTLPAYRLGDISISDVSLDDHVGVILPDWAPPNEPPQGVLGLDFLTRYKPLFNRRDRTIKLYAPGAIPDHVLQNWTKATLTPLYMESETRPLYRTNVVIRGIDIPCVVDLGASGTIFNSAAYRRMLSGVFVNRSRAEGFTTGSRIQDVFDNEDRAISVRIAKLRIGATSWSNQFVIVYNAQIFAELGVANEPFCLIGADLFSDRSFMLDFKEEELLIGPNYRG